MNDEQRAYRDLWLAEMGAYVPEWRPGERPRPRRMPPPPPAMQPYRETCPHCRIDYDRKYLPAHITRIHPAGAESTPGENPVGGAPSPGA